jgi:hypothetical protein
LFHPRQKQLPEHLDFSIIKTFRITMAGVKRSRDGPKVQGKTDVDSPYIAMFEAFRSELDEHHDSREKITKASRDITASSKKM